MLASTRTEVRQCVEESHVRSTYGRVADSRKQPHHRHKHTVQGHLSKADATKQNVSTPRANQEQTKT